MRETEGKRIFGFLNILQAKYSLSVSLIVRFARTPTAGSPASTNIRVVGALPEAEDRKLHASPAPRHPGHGQ